MQTGHSDGTRLAAAQMATPLGEMLAVWGQGGLCMLAFTDEKGFAAAVAGVCRHYGADGLTQQPQAAWAERVRWQLDGYFSGSLRVFDLPLAWVGTPFQQAAWRVLNTIPYGQTLSYAAQARALGRPTAVRAVASANGRNNLSLIVPCHRVIGSNGRLTGYAGGLWRKRALLDWEREGRKIGL